MLFDEKISENISLSRILDCFITEDEKPSVIINFLKQYDERNISSILESSWKCGRLFQLDFLYKCSRIELMEFYRIMMRLSQYARFSIIHELAWKVLQSDAEQEIKDMFKKILNTCLPIGRHPYNGRIGTEMSRIETIFKKSGRPIEEIAHCFSNFDQKSLEFYFSHAVNSLFMDRIFEDDFFNLLDFKVQFIAIKNVFISSKSNGERFLMQILDSDIDTDLKYMAYKEFKNSGFSIVYLLKNEVVEIIDRCESYAEMMMNINLYGIDECASDMIIYLLFKDFNKLLEMYDFDRDVIVNNYDVCDLIEYVKNNEK